MTETNTHMNAIPYTGLGTHMNSDMTATTIAHAGSDMTLNGNPKMQSKPLRNANTYICLPTIEFVYRILVPQVIPPPGIM